MQTIPLVTWTLDDGSGAISVPVPGDIYLALYAAGRIPHPMSDRAEAACAWVREQVWCYRTAFATPHCDANQRVILDFEGLDTFATIWLNGVEVAATDNMFRRWRIDVTAHLAAGANELALHFTPPMGAVDPVPMPPFPMASSPSADNLRNFMRKAQFGWGWDFAPDLPTAGIWKAATLRVETCAVLTDVTFCTERIDDAVAHVVLTAGADAWTGAGLAVAFTLHGPDGTLVCDCIVALAANACRIALAIPRPMLWWTPELGAAHLYTLTATLHADGVAVDHRALRVGVRTIALDTAPDPLEPGTRFFRFVLNGLPIFARGGNWVPPTSLVGAIDTPLYRRLLHLAADASMNMVRVWGGGIYEHDAFYDLCDELGLLVWQDFMFACAPYPEHDPGFVANVRSEVKDQVKRLRHHACLALWCGNNESQAIQGFANSRAGGGDPVLGVLYYDHVIPEVLARLDAATPYRPGSPFGGPGDNLNSMHEGDIHDWTVWHGLPVIPDDGSPVGEYDRSPAGVAWTRYAEDMGRFISEYGIQSAPSMAAFRRALPPDQLELGSPGFMNRLKDRPVDKVNAMLVTTTGLPATLAEYIDFTQFNQAEGLAFGIAHFRRRKPHCSGSLIWQFNDCWPGISWSIVDYDGFAKAAYYHVKRAYAHVAASFRATPDGIELWIVNDTLAPAAGTAQLALDRFDGGEQWRLDVAYAVAPNASACVWSGAVDCGPSLVLSVRDDAVRFPANRHLFAPFRELVRRAPAAPHVVVESADARTMTVTFTAVDYLVNVHIISNDEDVAFDDNYVDLRAGETRVVTVTHPVQVPAWAELALHWR